MIFSQTQLPGAYLIEPERRHDERGFFARTWCRDEFRAQGLDAELVQCSLSFNLRRGTLRGMHYQAAPHAETKLVRCTRGAVYDVIVDPRPESQQFGFWQAFELTADNRRQLLIPPGLAHGFLTLADDTELFYQMSQVQVASAARGIRWDDPLPRIDWPASPAVISARDASWPPLTPLGACRSESVVAQAAAQATH